MDTISGVVERITYENEENGFCVIKIRSKGFPDLVTLVGNLASITVGAIIQAKGDWRQDSKFGKQFAVKDYKELVPATVAGIEKYLGSGLIKGIGPVYAKKIVRHFKEDTLRIIEEQPDSLIDVEGIGSKRVNLIKKAWQEQKEVKNVMLFLQSHGVSTGYAVKIYKTYGNDSIQIVKENPYRLADDIWGIGFRTADKIAQQMGFDKNSYERCASGIIYILNELANEGHCYEVLAPLVTKTEEILEIDRTIISYTIDRMIVDKRLIKDGEEAIYLPSFYYSEIGVMKRIQEILLTPTKYYGSDVQKVIEVIEEKASIKYDLVQKEAIEKAVQSKIMILTGGPGTGKTTTNLAIIQVFQQLGGTVLLAAPTGRAAKRMSEATMMEAKTIHRLLEYKPTDGYKRNEENPLECDVLILDETSMVDVVLMYHVLKAVSNETIVIFVGDVDQLPSVGPGNVLQDLIQSGAINVVKLTRIFRQAQGSAIITNAHRINKGQFPELQGSRDRDFFFIEAQDPTKVVETIRDLCKTRLPSYYQVNPTQDIQVLCPMQRGDTGAVNLNQVLQQALNPSTVSIRHGGTNYFLGDKVMQIRNNYDKNVFNGDIGRITDLDTEERRVQITYDELAVDYDVTELDEVMLAYATTVHKSQGSEYKIVVAPLTMQHYMMLQRNLLYTCVTRAKKVMVLVGTKKAIQMAIQNNKITQRQTMLAKRLENSIVTSG